MFNTGNCASVPLVANIDGNGNNNGWGAEGSWLWFIIVIFAIFGWGGFGNGFGGNGMNGINTNILQTGFGIQQAINADTVANMQNTNALQSQLANCCCETREAIQGVNYNMAQNTCALQNTMNSNTRDIIDSQNAGTRAILDYLCNEKISSLQAENSDLRRAASQDRQSALLTTQMAAQTQQIINAVNPSAIPAYVVPNPNAYAYGCGCNTGCGC